VSNSLPNGLATTTSNDEVKIVKTINSPESSENGNDASVVARNIFWEIEDADAPTGWSSVFFFMFLKLLLENFVIRNYPYSLWSFALCSA
jgi:hypothetical protein